MEIKPVTFFFTSMPSLVEDVVQRKTPAYNASESPLTL